MCTNILLRTNNDRYLFARTMDFSFDLDPSMIFVPRNYPLSFTFIPEGLKKHHAMLGLAKNIGSYVMADGVNEHGLAGGALYFEDYAQYEKDTSLKRSLASHEVMMWILGTCKNIEEVKHEFNRIHVVEYQLALVGKTPPLHWTFQDENGETVIVEITSEGTIFHENKLGVLTNSPNYQWHLTNVRNYIGLSPHHTEALIVDGLQFMPFGQGNGTFGLPGDLTPPSRFIRALYAKLSIKQPEDEEEMLVAATHILNNVDIPKGSVVTQRNTLDYTQYTTYILQNQREYVYRLYDELKYHRISMSDYDLDQTEIIIIP